MDAMDCLLVKAAGEIGIKSLKVRKHFMAKLVDNLKVGFQQAGLPVPVVRRLGLVLELPGINVQQAVPVLQRVFGLHAIIQAQPHDTAGLDALCAQALPFALKKVKAGTKFAVSAHRVGHHAFSSKDIENKLGRMILDAQPKAKVNLDNPEAVVGVEVRDRTYYLCVEEWRGPGGYPVGVEGDVGMFFEGKPEEALAAWLMLKRGCRVHPILTGNEKKVQALLDQLAPWNCGHAFKPSKPEDLPQLIAEKKLSALVKADTELDAQALQAFNERQPLPVLRPLLLYPEAFAKAHRKLLEATA